MKMTSPSFMANTNVNGGSLSKRTEYIVYREGKYFVSPCLNVDVSSFGETIDEAITNLKEAVELYLEDTPQETQYRQNRRDADSIVRQSGLKREDFE
jgi:predicted RNase H-like HicB family nuclease